MQAPEGSSDNAIAAHSLFNDQGHVRNLEEVERVILIVALRKYRGNRSEMARALGIGRTTLYRKLAHHGLRHGGFRRAENDHEVGWLPEFDTA